MISCIYGMVRFGLILTLSVSPACVYSAIESHTDLVELL